MTASGKKAVFFVLKSCDKISGAIGLIVAEPWHKT